MTLIFVCLALKSSGKCRADISTCVNGITLS